MPKLIMRALHNQPLPLYGDGKQVRDWIYVVDNCEAIDLITRKGEAGAIYNVASGSEYTNLEVAKNILEILEKPENLIDFVPDRPGHDRRYSLDIAKLRGLGWRPERDFISALNDTVNWYAENRWWWEPLVKDEFFKADTPWLES